MIEIINKICSQLPPGWIIELCLTQSESRGGEGPYVNLVNPHGEYPSLPDSSGKTIVDQLEDALAVVKRWGET